MEEGNNTKCVGKKRFNGSYQRTSERACVTFSPPPPPPPPLPLGQGKIIFFLMVICNSLLLLKSSPFNVINCIKCYVNCSALTGAYDCQKKYLFVCFVCLYANHLP